MPNVTTPASAPCLICQTTTPRPACPSCLPRMDDIERSERTRMATRPREAIAQNESRRLPVPKQWRAWARVDEGLNPLSSSAACAPSATSAFNSEPEAPDSS